MVGRIDTVNVFAGVSAVHRDRLTPKRALGVACRKDYAAVLRAVATFPVVARAKTKAPAASSNKENIETSGKHDIKNDDSQSLVGKDKSNSNMSEGLEESFTGFSEFSQDSQGDSQVMRDARPEESSTCITENSSDTQFPDSQGDLSTRRDESSEDSTEAPLKKLKMNSDCSKA
ncbi:hypothetical protein HPB51_019715 [Rhipicephalus microplus]|uniref:Uncharacterized protein n=1 Tax=Rhipicephalus microplus TaxID=6941 RepID=A0A9J6F5A7_RHIMP|nr:hypothetical protein HPB51_019715 [Rhipicephalus microplus]